MAFSLDILTILFGVILGVNGSFYLVVLLELEGVISRAARGR
jgi:hypothetical protein